MPDRLAKRPPDPDDLASFRAFRNFNAEIAELAMELIRAARPGALAEAETLAAQALDAAQAQRAKAALDANPEFAKKVAPLADRANAPPNSGAIVARLAGLPKAPGSPTALIVACARLVRLCTVVDIKLSAAAAAAHSTAERAGLHHPARQTVLEALHSAARNAEAPLPGEPELLNLIEIAVTEDLGRCPAQNPADLIQALAARFNLPLGPESFPNGWQPSRPPTPPRKGKPWVPPDPNSPMGQLLECVMRQENHPLQLE